MKKEMLLVAERGSYYQGKEGSEFDVQDKLMLQRANSIIDINQHTNKENKTKQTKKQKKNRTYKLRKQEIYIYRLNI